MPEQLKVFRLSRRFKNIKSKKFGRGDDLGSFAMVSWSIWLDRNQLVHETKTLKPKDVVYRASFLWENSGLPTSGSSKGPTSISSQSTSWRAPPIGTVKIDVDAAVFQGSQRVGLAIVAWNAQGVVLMAQILCLDGVFSSHVAELLAAREGKLMASQQDWNHVILETDASNVARSIAHSLQHADDEAIVSLIQHLGSRLSNFQVQHCRRTANGVAHIMASHGLTHRL